MVIGQIQPLIGTPAPDWTKTDDYPDPSTTSMEEIAEQFMRRNLAFKQAVAQIEKFFRPGPPAEVPELGLVNGIPALEYHYFGGLNQAVAWLIQEFAPKRWNDRIRPTATQSQEPPDTEHSFAPTLSQADIVVRFNPGCPIGPQLDAAKALLESEQLALRRRGEIAPTEHRKLVSGADKYRLYLRLLDAEVAGASRARMAEVLFAHMPNKHPEYHGNRAVRDSLKAAKKLRDGEYRNLPLTEK